MLNSPLHAKHDNEILRRLQFASPSSFLSSLFSLAVCLCVFVCVSSAQLLAIASVPIFALHRINSYFRDEIKCIRMAALAYPIRLITPKCLQTPRHRHAANVMFAMKTKTAVSVPLSRSMCGFRFLWRYCCRRCCHSRNCHRFVNCGVSVAHALNIYYPILYVE